MVSVIDTFRVEPDNMYKISSLNIIPFSEIIIINGKQVSRNYYSISYEKGIFSLLNSIHYIGNDLISISYKSVKVNLKPEYKKRSLIVVYDDLLLDTMRISTSERSQLTTESIFGKNIQKSGALIRGFTVGSNRDFQLNSGLRLQLSGRLSDDLEIVAALSDENTPIQPEGNTETLEEIDKVFIEVKHKNAIGTFGDYELNEITGEFSSVTRKLQGLKGEFLFDNHKGIIAIAGSRGKFNTNQFNGQDGNQGPYRLFGVNNEREIIVIAGSEKVFLDGEILKRGENNDYIIDYSNSEVVFTPKRLITSASRISIDFEYTDLKYRRNFLGANYSTKLLSDKLNFGFSYYREGDDENNPIEFNFSESDLELLRNSGNNRNAASRPGVSIAQPDSLGRIIGIYSKVDTTINSQAFSYYLYLPGNLNSIYNVTFSFVGKGSGDYQKESLGKYKFVGIGNGSYLPVIFLPLPELKQVGSFSLQANVTKGIYLIAELSGSSWNRNRFSEIDDADNIGYARKLQLTIEPREVEIGKLSLGKIGFSLKDRFIQGKYSTLDRIDAVEFNRYYNLSDIEKNDQTLREINLDLFPSNQFSIISKYGYVKQGDQFSSNRFNSILKFLDQQNYQFDYNLDFVFSKNNNITTIWNRQNGKAFYSLGFIKPGIDFTYENKEDLKKDSLLVTSLKYMEAAPFVELEAGNSFNIKAGYSYREESFPFHQKLLLQSQATTRNIQATYKGIKEITSSLNITFRKKTYTEEFKQIGYSNNETILFLSQNRFNFWNSFLLGELFYQASTEQSARLEKIFIKVPKGTGSYIYIGDINNNGIPEENEFQLTSYDGEYIIVTIPTDQLFPVIDLKYNTRWKIDFNKIISGNDLLSSALKSISTETFWRIEENSKQSETSKIYLMQLSNYLNDSTTIRGSQLFQHDINILQFSNEFSVRLRYLQRRNLNQYAGGVERGFFRERSLRFRFKMISEINNQTEFTNQIDNLDSPPSTNRAREVNRNDITTEFSYRPVNNIEAGLKIQVGRSEDYLPVNKTIVDLNSVIIRMAYSIANIGRLRLEAERTELLSNTLTVNIPFEITRGNVIGKNYFWRVFFDYRIASYVQTSFSYDGRLQGGGRVIHTMRAEARAYF
ncbi:MAG: hypothetical protein RDU14_15745 [Melioribacteraceae bacterium]|nr:hypothetical protein [Melioribacteraceae bacterium]